MIATQELALLCYQIEEIIGMNKYTARLLIFATLVAVVVALRFSGITDVVTIDYIRQNKAILFDFIQSNYWLSVFMYIASYIFLVTFSVPVTIIMTISGGYFYGTVQAAAYSNIGATIGSLCSFLATRYLVGDYLRERYSKAYHAFNDRFERDGVSYLLSLHFFPVTPFFLINVLAGLSTIPAWTFAWTTSLGIVPGSLVYAFAGRQFNYIDSPADLLSGPVMIALGLLALLSLLPIIVRKLQLFE